MSTHFDARKAVPNAAWFKSSYSSEAGGNCIEVAPLPSAHVALRDSKVLDGPVLVLSLTAFTTVTNYVKGLSR
ncbi:DUF397 domain-containing protein [Streptomyces sp. NPDC005474]|uniref:DUF397 domain-containing protein n=1 Tax=Streptomyces sp. NPDC005474 TaxID=3154878 RepID=UPI0034524E6A